MTIVVRPHINNLFSTLRGAEVFLCNYQQKWLFVQYIKTFYVLDINELLHQMKTSSFIMMRTLHSTSLFECTQFYFIRVDFISNQFYINIVITSHTFTSGAHRVYNVLCLKSETKKKYEINKKNIKELPVDFLFTFRSFSFPFSSVFSIFFSSHFEPIYCKRLYQNY